MASGPTAVIGLGATGTVMAAALLAADPETVLVGRDPALGPRLAAEGVSVSGALEMRAPVKHFASRIGRLADFEPAVIVVCTKTFHLPQVAGELAAVYRPGVKIVAAQNGLGPEQELASRFSAADVWRMSLNYGAVLRAPGVAQAVFFHRPNHLGCLAEADRPLAARLAEHLTAAGLDTEAVADIDHLVWRKMVMKCTMSALCAVTDLTFGELLGYPPSRKLAEAMMDEAIAVAAACGHRFGEDFRRQAIAYLEQAGGHKDSMCGDLARRVPTEIDYLGAKIVEYGRAHGVPTPNFEALTRLVKTIENRAAGRTRPSP